MIALGSIGIQGFVFLVVFGTIELYINIFQRFGKVVRNTNAQRRIFVNFPHINGPDG